VVAPEEGTRRARVSRESERVGGLAIPEGTLSIHYVTLYNIRTHIEPHIEQLQRRQIVWKTVRESRAEAKDKE
jgi:hypothetical protein